MESTYKQIIPTFDELISENDQLVQVIRHVRVPRRLVQVPEFYNKIYYKITNLEETHFGYKYNDGINIDTKPFVPINYDDKFSGLYFTGLHFTDLHYLHNFVNYGVNIREVIIPLNTPVHTNYENHTNHNICIVKYKAPVIYFGKKYNMKCLSDIVELFTNNMTKITTNSFEYFIEHCNSDNIEVIDIAIKCSESIKSKSIIYFIIKKAILTKQPIDYDKYPINIIIDCFIKRNDNMFIMYLKQTLAQNTPTQ
jgi:hypothetical protein